MTDYFDWLTAGDCGLSADRLARTFNLSPEELRRTADALAPAYTVALQRMVSDFSTWNEVSRRFLPHLSLGGEDSQASPAPLNEALFGSARTAEQIARQVSLATGIAPETVTKLMGHFSVMTLHTMVQMMAANMARNQPSGLAEGDYPRALAEMMRRSANAVEAFGRPSDEARTRESRLDDTYLARLFGTAFTGALPITPPEPGRSGGRRPAERSGAEISDLPTGLEPFSAMMEGLRRGLAPEAPEAETEEKPEPKAAKDEAETGANAEEFDFAKGGRAFQDAYLEQMEALFRFYQPDTKQDPET